MHEQGSAYCAGVRGAMADGQCRDLYNNKLYGGDTLSDIRWFKHAHNNEKNSNIVCHLQL